MTDPATPQAHALEKWNKFKWSARGPSGAAGISEKWTELLSGSGGCGAGAVCVRVGIASAVENAAPTRQRATP